MYMRYPCDYYNPSYLSVKPSPSDFELNVVSRHPNSDGKKLRKFNLNGFQTVGAFEESFEIHFTNHFRESVQVRLSIDGVDILTGKPATLEASHDMWLVRAGRTLHLKAWPENQEGGARFVFAPGHMGVAQHLIGDEQHRGTIAAAVFTEGARPIFVGQQVNSRRYEPHPWHSMKNGNRIGGPLSGGSTYTSSASASVSNVTKSSPPEPALYYLNENLSVEASVGAGEFVEQKTKTVAGLTKPELHSIVRVNYLWWDELQQALQNQPKPVEEKLGFPGAKVKSFIDLTGVPKVESNTRVVDTGNVTPAKEIKRAIDFIDFTLEQDELLF